MRYVVLLAMLSTVRADDSCCPVSTVAVVIATAALVQPWIIVAVLVFSRRARDFCSQLLAREPASSTPPRSTVGNAGSTKQQPPRDSVALHPLVDDKLDGSTHSLAIISDTTEPQVAKAEPASSWKGVFETVQADDLAD
eukprot:Sspe_Gene.82734::Locus_54229_Transcript_1_1_Confidence_1.000_Length_496::g.82734::m.82734